MHGVIYQFWYFDSCPLSRGYLAWFQLALQPSFIGCWPVLQAGSMMSLSESSSYVAEKLEEHENMVSTSWHLNSANWQPFLPLRHWCHPFTSLMIKLIKPDESFDIQFCIASPCSQLFPHDPKATRESFLLSIYQILPLIVSPPPLRLPTLLSLTPQSRPPGAGNVLAR